MGGRGYFNNVCYADSRVLTPAIKATPDDLRVSLLLLVGETEGGHSHKDKFMLCFKEERGRAECPRLPPVCCFLIVFSSK